MPRLEVKFLGTLEVRLTPGPMLDIASKKTRALLAYLALPTGRSHSRDKLASLLWSDRGDEQARNSLRQALTELGRAFGAIEPSPLVKGRETLALDPAIVGVDVLTFEQLAGSDSASDLRLAAALYAGDLLDGLDVRDSAFDEWLTVERQRLRTLAATMFKKLLARDNGPSAVDTAQRLLALDPLQEEGHRALMRLHAEAGESGAALRQYELCSEVLKRELDVAPSPETKALHQWIRQQSSAAGPERMEVRPTRIGDGRLPVPSGGGVSKLSIAVLPFRNLSDDRAQQYLSDGITEDILTELSRFRSLTVIARHSSFAFRDHSLEFAEVGQRLGVQCIVDGSVRRIGDRARITARLIDAESGSQLWSEHYDRALTEIFAVQDQIVHAIVATLPARVDEAGMQLARRKAPENLTAYDCFLRGLECCLTMDRADEPMACQWFEKALAWDSNLAIAYSWLAVLHVRYWWRDLSGEGLERALALARKGASLDPNDGRCQGILGGVQLYRKEFDEAAFQLERALALNPNDTIVMVTMAWLATYRGRPQEGLDWMDTAFHLNPYPPPWFESSKGMIFYVMRRYAEAAASFKRSVGVDAWVTMYLVASYGQLDQLKDAEACNSAFLTEHPGMSLHQFAAIEPYENAADLAHLLDGLCKAGLTA
jgi:TolB-like protein/DNA-binding SARP family transcriptional activator/Tfp pilus assembly protein PilF